MVEKTEGLNTDAPGFAALGQRLADERKRLGLTPDESAALGGIGRASHYRYESGAKAPPTEYLLALAAHGLDVLYVLTGQRGKDVLGVMTAEESALVDNYRAASSISSRVV